MRIKNIPFAELEKAAKESLSAAETCRKLNLPDKSGTISRIKKFLIEKNVDLSHWTGQLWSKGKTSLDDPRLRKEKSIENVFTENSNASSSYVRSLILKKNLLEYKCQICSMNPEWNGKQLNLQLDHINGVRTDQRLNNLRWLCPNCHTQTETYGGKNKKSRVTDEDLLTALESSDNIRQALIAVGLDNGRNYKRAKRLKNTLPQ